jgi:hypothetical protein
VGWFAQVTIFTVRGVSDSFQKYSHNLVSLSEETVKLALDIVEVMLSVQPYEKLKKRLLQAHTLDKFERFKHQFILFTVRGCQRCWSTAPGSCSPVCSFAASALQAEDSSLTREISRT